MRICFGRSKMSLLAFLFFLLLNLLWPFKIQADASVEKSLKYLVGFQDAQSGGISEEGSDEPLSLQTDWSIIALSASGYDSSTVGQQASLVDYAIGGACDLTLLSDIERRVIALESTGVDTQNLSTCSLTSKIFNQISTEGRIGENLVSTVFGVIALESAGLQVPQNVIDYIVLSQDDDGGWSSGYGTESNFTAQTIMALSGSSKEIPKAVFDRAKNYLKNLQIESGGIKYDGGQWSTQSDAFSDSYVLQAIYALGESPNDSFWQIGGETILDDLASLGNADGSYSFNRSYGKMSPVWTTSIVLIALNRSFLPILNLPTLSWPNSTPVTTVSAVPSLTVTPTQSVSATPVSVTSTPSVSATPIITATFSPTTTSTQSPIWGATATPVIVRSSISRNKQVQAQNSSYKSRDPISQGSPQNTSVQTKSDKSDAEVLGAVATEEDALNLYLWGISTAVISFIMGVLVKTIEKKYINEKN